MGFGPKQADIEAIKTKTDNLPSDPASEANIETAITAAHATTDAGVSAVGVIATAVQAKTDNLPSDPASETGGIARKYPFLDFWSAPEDKLTVTSTPTDIAFPDIVVSGLPTGLTIRRVVLILTVRALFDTSGSDNYINAASKSIRVKKSTGSWATGSIAAITFANASLYCVASSKEGGPVLIGDVDIQSIVDGNGTYNVSSEETNNSDAIVSLGDDLELYDVQVGIRVFYS